MSTPAGLMDRLPAAVLLQLAQSFLTDEDAQALGATCMAMPSLLRHYAVKQRVSLRSSLIEDGNFAAGSRRFGVATAVRIDRRACEAPELQWRLERLPRRVRTVHVAQEFSSIAIEAITCVYFTHRPSCAQCCCIFPRTWRRWCSSVRCAATRTKTGTCA